MLLIKYDGKTNVCAAIKHFGVVDCNCNVGNDEVGYYYLDDQSKLRYTKTLPDVPYYIYDSTQVSKWNSNLLINLPIEIRQLARKYVQSYEGLKQKSVIQMAAWTETDEGLDFWVEVERNQFHKAFKYLANHKNLLINKTKDHEIKLQDKTSSSRAGAEPKGSIISCKKSIATIASGHLEYGGGIRG
jgi:hypothetical protein